jgi:hypothetical protein
MSIRMRSPPSLDGRSRQIGLFLIFEHTWPPTVLATNAGRRVVVDIRA